MKNCLDWVVYAASVIAAAGAIVALLRRCLAGLFAPLEKKLSYMDKRECRHFLVSFLCDIENGVQKDEVQWKLAHDTYDYYRNILKENSYVHDKWERVVNHASN